MHAIGMEEWKALPNIFDDPKAAADLEHDKSFWCYTYMFPHKTRKNIMCSMEAGIHYSELTGLFTKYVKHNEMIPVEL